MVAFHWVAFYGSIKYANVSVALVCFSATGFFTALLEPLILRRKSDMVEVILGLMVIAGIIIVFDFHPHYKLGILFGIAAAVGSAIFPILNKQLLLRFTPKVLTWYEFFAGFIFLCMVLPVYFIFFHRLISGPLPWIGFGCHYWRSSVPSSCLIYNCKPKKSLHLP